MRERESIFQDYVSDLRRKEKEDKASQKEKVSRQTSRKCSIIKCQWVIVRRYDWPQLKKSKNHNFR